MKRYVYLAAALVLLGSPSLAHALPDLAVDSISLTVCNPFGACDDGLPVGRTAQVALTVSNAGPDFVDDVPFEVWLSQDEVLDPDTDVLLLSDSMGSVEGAVEGMPAATTSKQFNVDIPWDLPEGEWAPIALVDGDEVVLEEDETNNERMGLFRSRIGPPELSANGLLIDWCHDGLGVCGVGLPMSWVADAEVTVTNAGPQSADFRFTLWLSADETLDDSDGSSDRPIYAPTGVHHIEAASFDEASGTWTPTQHTFQVEANIPFIQTPASGGYHVFLVVDPADDIKEAVETDNDWMSEWTVPVLSSPSLNLIDVEAPRRLFIGRDAVVRFSLVNNGQADAEFFNYGIFLSKDDLVQTTRDIQIGGGHEDLLIRNSLRNYEVPVHVPQTVKPGSMYVGAGADLQGWLPEPKGNNQRVAKTLVPVLLPAPDLTVSELWAPALASAGETVTLAVTLENDGVIPAEFSYGVYVSANDLITDHDQLLTEGTASLVEGERKAVNLRVSIPQSLADGTVYLGVLTDHINAVPELDEGNNDGVGGRAVQILPPELGIVTPYAPEGFLGAPYTWRFAAGGGSGSYTWSVAVGTLPPGLTLDAQTGVVSGTPEATGSWPIALSATSGTVSSVRTYNLRILAPQVSLSVATQALPAALIQQGYDVQLAGLGGTPPYTWSATGGLPAGLELTSGGSLQGVPTEVGVSTLEVLVRDTRGSVATASLDMMVADGARLTITTRYVLPGSVGNTYLAGFEAVGGRPPLTWSVGGGALPPGLTLDSESGLLTGTPTTSGEYSFQVAVTDRQGLFDTNNVNLQVVGQPLRIIDPALPEGAVGTPFRAKLSVLPGTSKPPYVWSIASGALPDGIDLQADEGLLVGTPTEGGAWPIVLSVKDSVGNSGRHPVVLVVTDAARALQAGQEPEPAGCSSAGGSVGWMALLLVALGLFRGRRGTRVPTAAALVAVATVAVAGQASAATWTYGIHREPKAYEPLKGGTPVALPSSGSTLLQIETFRFYDTEISTVTVHSNGILVLGEATGDFDTNLAIPSSAAPNGYIAPWWDELERGSGMVSQKVDQSGALVLEFNDWQVKDTNTTLDFQVSIDPSTNDIRVHYGDLVGTTNDSSATVGIESWDGFSGTRGLDCSPKCRASDFPSHTLITYSARANLTVSEFHAPPAAQASVGLPISGTIANVGGQGTAKFWVKAFLSDDQVLDAGDRELEGGQLMSVNAQSEKPVIFYAGIPDDVEPGQTWWLFLVANGARTVGEYNYGDNASEPLRVVISPPSPDLVAAFLSGPTSMQPGTPASAAVKLTNRGSAAAEAQWRVVASRNTYISPEDLVLAQGTVSLGAKNDTALPTTLDLPVTLDPPATMPTGIWYLGVMIDPEDAVVEPLETNNSALLQMNGVPRAVAVGSDTGKVIPSSPDALPHATVGVPYSYRLQLAGGDGSVVWTPYDAKTLPAGITLSSTGELHGTPTEPGKRSFQVWATTRDTTGKLIYVPANVILEVLEVSGALTVVTEQLPDGILSAEYAVALMGVGGTPPYSWGISGALPTGVGLTESGVLGGVPRETGTFPIDVTLVDGDGDNATATLNLRVRGSGSLVITNVGIPQGTLGQPYEVDLRASGGTGSYVWDVEPELPAGLSLDRLNGTIYGTPRHVGVYDLVVKVSDAANRFDTNTFRLVVSYDQGLSVTTLRLPTASLGRAYETRLQAIGGVEPYRWQLTGEGDLPDHFTLSEDGVLSGVPVDTEEPVYAFIVTVADAEGRTGLAGLSLRVAEPPPVLQPEGCSAAGGSAGLGLLLVGAASLLSRRRRG